MSLPELIAAMGRTEFYPHRPASVTLVQTHISYVLLAGDHVYKVKKPVHFSFLDFSTLERRRHFCHEEVRLNRRLAPDTYLGVAAIGRHGDAFRLESEPHPNTVEYAVHMRRLPDDRLLDGLLDRGAVTEPMIDVIAARLAAFHRSADAGPEITANGDPAAVRRILDDNYANARRFRDVTIAASDDDAIQVFATSFLHTHDALFRQRQVEQRIKDGHGDLHTEHICFANSLVIFDCIEFNPLFRYCDVASDIAFLAMDLDYHQRPDLAAYFIERYAAHSGDAEVQRLVPFYQCYRAYVRGKVDSLKSTESEVGPEEQATAARSARQHFALAYRYTWSYTPRLVVIAGLSGTGKTAVAAALHERTGFAHINSDVVRKRLAGVPLGQRAPDIYTPEYGARTYQTMLAEASQRLAAGRGVILDATFQQRAHRDPVRDVARQHGIPLLFVECRCSDDDVRHRLQQRRERGDSVSDADWGVYLQQQQHYEPFTGDETVDHLVVDTSGSVVGGIAAIERELRAASRLRSGGKQAAS